MFRQRYLFLLLFAGSLFASLPSTAADFVKFINTVKQGKVYQFQFNLLVYSGQAKTVDLYVDGQYNQRLATVSANASPGSYIVNRSLSPLSLGAHSLVLRECLTSSGNCSNSTSYALEVLQDADARFATQMSEWNARKANPAGWGVGPRYNQNSGKAIGAYYAEWRAQAFPPKNIPVENMTHFYYAFLPPCGSYNATQKVADGVPFPDGSTPTQAQRNEAASAAAAGRLACNGKQPGEIAIYDTQTALWNTGFNNYNEDDPYAGVFAELYRMKRTFPHIKIMASIGGWSFSDPFFEFARTTTGRNRFAESVANFLERYDVFDGVDIDWEYPGKGGLTGGHQGSSSDALYNRYLLAVTRSWLDELGRRKGRSYEMSVAVGASQDLLSRANWPAAQSYLNRINLMTYDFYGAWNSTYGSQAPLYSNNCATTPVNGDLSADASVRYLTARGIPASKLSIGMTTVLRGWQGIQGGDSGGPFNGTASGGQPINHVTHPSIPSNRPQDWGVIHLRSIFAGYWWSGAQMPPGWGGNNMFYEMSYGGGWGGIPYSWPYGLNGYQVLTDYCANAQYLWRQSTGTLITGDTAYSASAKGNYARQQGLGGVFMWQIDDDPNYLLPRANRELGNTNY